MNAVWQHARQRGNALLVLLAIADNANDAGMAYPSVATLARKARVSERTVQYVLERLVADGALRVERGGGRGHTHRYWVTVQELHPSEEKGARVAGFARSGAGKGASPAPIREPKRVQVTTEKGATTRKTEGPNPSLGLRTRGRARYEPSIEPSRGDTPPLPPPSPSRPLIVPRPQPKPNKSAAVLDALRAAGLPDVLSARDHAAIKKTPLTAGQIVQAFGAVYHGEWGDDWLRDNLSVRLVIERWAGFAARRAGNGRVQEAKSAVARELAELRAEGVIDEYGNFVEAGRSRAR